MNSGLHRVGVFGGTFDPVHIGHLRTAQEVQEQLEIPDFRFMLAGQPPHRQSTHGGINHRLAMLRLALQGHPVFTVDERETRRKGPSYMVDSLRELRAELPGSSLMLIVGQDSVNALDSWHRWRELFELAHIVILQRPDHPPSYAPGLAQEIRSRTIRHVTELDASNHGCVIGVDVIQFDISSSKIRDLIRRGRSERFLVPQAVFDYIEVHRLYR